MQVAMGTSPKKKENRFGRGSLGVSGSTGERGQAADVGGGTSTQERNQKERKRREACAAMNTDWCKSAELKNT
jgi:hypothetical protein